LVLEVEQDCLGFYVLDFGDVLGFDGLLSEINNIIKNDNFLRQVFFERIYELLFIFDRNFATILEHQRIIKHLLGHLYKVILFLTGLHNNVVISLFVEVFENIELDLLFLDDQSFALLEHHLVIALRVILEEDQSDELINLLHVLLIDFCQFFHIVAKIQENLHRDRLLEPLLQILDEVALAV